MNSIQLAFLAVITIGALACGLTDMKTAAQTVYVSPQSYAISRMSFAPDTVAEDELNDDSGDTEPGTIIE